MRTITSHSSIMRTDLVRRYGGHIPELRWHSDWWLVHHVALFHGYYYSPKRLYQVNLRTRSYSNGAQSAAHHAVLAHLRGLLIRSPYFLELANQTGVLGEFGLPFVLGLPIKPSKALLGNATRRSLEVAARKLPVWAQRVLLKMRKL